jgi:hypothetical protein
MATQFQVPGALVGNEPEMAVPALSGLVEVKTGVAAQVGSLGGKSWKVTVPVGSALSAPVSGSPGSLGNVVEGVGAGVGAGVALTVAVSEIEVPTGPPAEGVVVMVGVASV